ncbi:MAG TPA: MFS transporter [Acetobacteraceae bacterium]|nr:MFS transporter [Acetobacteraceae bacterium]
MRPLPFFYGWIIVAVVFVTMGIAVTARTAFSLFFPPLLSEFGWDQSVTAGAFSFGFLVSASLSPVLGRAMDRYGPRLVIEAGVLMLAAGLLLATLIHSPWQLYATLGVLVSGGTVCLGYSGQSLFLPNWFVRRRGLAMSIAFSGVGVGAIALLPWLQTLIQRDGWRTACMALGLLTLFLLAPLNLLLRQRPEDLGLASDGDAVTHKIAAAAATETNVIDAAWAATDWTLPRALRTARFWWLALGYFGALYVWYAAQVHQTQYLLDIGFTPAVAAWALGAAGLIGIPGQIGLGHLSDRIGREWVWTAGTCGFALCFAAFLAMAHSPQAVLWLYVVVAAQGLLGYGITAVMGAIPAEIFQGRHYGSIFGTLMLAGIAGGAAGPFATALLHDRTGTYHAGFATGFAVSLISALAIWQAAPRHVRAVAGRVRRAG